MPVSPFLQRSIRAEQRFVLPRDQVGLSGGNNLGATGAAVVFQRIFFTDGLNHVARAALCFNPANAGAKPLNIERLGVLVSVAAMTAGHRDQYQFFASECAHAAHGVP